MCSIPDASKCKRTRPLFFTLITENQMTMAAYFFSKICESIIAEGGDPASGYFEGQFMLKEVESWASSFQTKMNKRQETAKAWAKKCEGM